MSLAWWPWTLAAALFGLAAALAGAAPAVESTMAARVVILANADDPDSVRIARHYAEVRGVPIGNVVALSMPTAETITWREFVATIWRPLLAHLVAAGRIDAIAMEASDALGRPKYAPNGHDISALVVCRGVPLKVGHAPNLFVEHPPFTARSEFRTNAGAVDAELALLALPNYPINAFVPNPLFQNARPSGFEASQVVKVSRLDGPTAAQAMGLVERAVAAERSGIAGRAYIDLSAHDPVGNSWLEQAGRELGRVGFEPAVHREPTPLPVTARFDAPVLYFGWYAADVCGPFKLPGFAFPPGAVALHIHSYSAGSLRSAEHGWTGPLVARGVTATVGNVHEPYLQFTHRPDLLVRALVRGENWVTAGFYALEGLSWQGILIGDPLYRPFAVPLAEQLAEPTRLSPLLAGYAVLREMEVLDRAGNRASAVSLGIAAQRRGPNLAVGVKLAQWFLGHGDAESAASALGFVTVRGTHPSTEWALAREAAQLLDSAGRTNRALEVWRNLLTDPALGVELREAWLADAIRVAVRARDETQVARWRTELEALARTKK